MSHMLGLYNEDAEECVLSACLTNVIGRDMCLDVLKSNMFFHIRSAKVFAAIERLQARQAVINMTTVRHELSSEFDETNVPGPSQYYFDNLQYVSCTIEEVQAAIPVVREIWMKREAMRIATETRLNIQDEPDANALVESLVSKYTALQVNDQTTTLHSARELTDKVLQSIIDIADGKATLGMRTGINQYDNATGGVFRGELVIIGAYTSFGKTAMAIQMTDGLCASGKHVLFFSLEMQAHQITQRLFTGHAKLDSMKFRRGGFDDADRRNANESARSLEKYNLHVDDIAGIHYMELIRRARQFARNNPLDAIVVDYIAKLKGDRKSNDGKTYEIASIVSALKNLSKELDVSVIAPSQIGREGMKVKPRLPHFQDSASIEQEADVAVIIDRPDKRVGRTNENENVAEIEIAKQRQGMPEVFFKLMFHPQWGRFESLAGRDDDAPQQLPPYYNAPIDFTGDPF